MLVKSIFYVYNFNILTYATLGVFKIMLIMLAALCGAVNL